MGEALVVRSAMVTVLQLVERGTVEQYLSVSVVFLLVSSVTLNMFLLWKLKVSKNNEATNVYLTKHMSVYHTNATCEHLRQGFKTLRKCKVCAHKKVAAA